MWPWATKEIGGYNEESRSEGATFSGFGRWPNRGRIRRDVGPDRDRLLDGNRFDRLQGQHDVLRRGGFAHRGQLTTSGVGVSAISPDGCNALPDRPRDPP